ncbi:MAG: T9SS type A sorting domain-containing protein [Bacteroidota bacterium]
MKYVSILLVAGVMGASGQALHELPFASRDNALELSIENSSMLAADHVTVTTSDVPSWLRLAPANRAIDRIAGRENAVVRFSLSIEESAPVGQEHRLSLVVSTASGMSWKKEVLISVAPPASFELLQNFPNPFNPSTTIAYQLPAESNVSVKIFDLLGREVAILANGPQQAGRHDVSWDGTRQASGMYVYELVAETAGGKQTVIRRTMMLVK